MSADVQVSIGIGVMCVVLLAITFVVAWRKSR